MLLLRFHKYNQEFAVEFSDVRDRASSISGQADYVAQFPVRTQNETGFRCVLSKNRWTLGVQHGAALSTHWVFHALTSCDKSSLCKIELRIQLNPPGRAVPQLKVLQRKTPCPHLHQSFSWSHVAIAWVKRACHRYPGVRSIEGAGRLIPMTKNGVMQSVHTSCVFPLMNEADWYSCFI